LYCFLNSILPIGSTESPPTVTVGGINGVGEPIIWCRRVRQPGYYQISFSLSLPLL